MERRPREGGMEEREWRQRERGMEERDGERRVRDGEKRESESRRERIPGNGEERDGGDRGRIEERWIKERRGRRGKRDVGG